MAQFHMLEQDEVKEINALGEEVTGESFVFLGEPEDDKPWDNFSFNPIQKRL